MGFPPSLPLDPFENAGRNIGDTTQLLPGYNPLPADLGTSTGSTRSVPSDSGVLGEFTRNLIQWYIPEQGTVEMYINPENITYGFSKAINEQRTKGGYMLQYWGEELIDLKISGTTGSSGVEGVQALLGVYRGEQLAFDPFALAVAAHNVPDDLSNLFAGQDFNNADNFFNLGTEIATFGGAIQPEEVPSLAALAFSVEMYYAGWIFRGYFKRFNIRESSQNIGLFNYDIDFTATQMRGSRRNFFGWQRNPKYGPSNSDPNLGVPLSYKGLESRATEAPPLGPRPRTAAETFEDRLESGGSIFSALFG